MSHRGPIWLAIAAVTMLAAPAADASVGKQSYEGPVATDGVDGRSPTVRLKVEFKKVHHRRGAPSRLIDWAQRAIALRCPDGSKIYGGPGTELDGGPGGFDELGFTGQKIKKGQVLGERAERRRGRYPDGHRPRLKEGKRDRHDPRSGQILFGPDL